MNFELILNYFKERLLSLEEDFPLIHSENISMPNKCFDKRGKSFWLDLCVVPKEKISISDAEELQKVQVICRINVIRNYGYSILMEATERISDLWSDRISIKAGFSFNNMQIYFRKIELDSLDTAKDISAIELKIDTDCYYTL